MTRDAARESRGMDGGNSTSFVFTGDIAFDKYMEGRWTDDELIAPELLDFLHSGEHVVANIEGPLLRLEDEATEGVAQLLHSMDPEVTRVLDRMGADIWNLCNNHMMDAGPEGVRATLDEAAKHDALTIGAGMDLDEASRPLYFPEAGGIGMIAVGYRRGCKPAGEHQAGCFLWHEMELIQQRIDEIRARCRWCVVVCHGGEEFTSLPSPYTRDRFHRYLEMGADVVVCHHPHVPMNYEEVGDKLIFYSLGNFIFDTDYQRAQYNTEKGILLKLKFTEERMDWEAQGLLIDRAANRVVGAPLPEIFVNVPPEDYELLAPLAAKMMVSAYKRQLIYLNPAEFKDADEAKWRENFLQPKRSGRVVGEGLDFHIILPLAAEAEKGDWQRSQLAGVKRYILEQI